MESDAVARSTLLKKVSVVFSESKFGSPYQNFLDTPCTVHRVKFLFCFFHPKEKALA